jgi:hypothetical protein
VIRSRSKRTRGVAIAAVRSTKAIGNLPGELIGFGAGLLDVPLLERLIEPIKASVEVAGVLPLEQALIQCVLDRRPRSL